MSSKITFAILFGLAAISVPTAAMARDDWGHHRISHHHRYAGAYGSYGNGAYGYPGYGRSAIFISNGHGHHDQHGHGYYSHGYDDGGHGYSRHSEHGYAHNDGYDAGFGGAHGYGDHGYGSHGQDHH